MSQLKKSKHLNIALEEIKTATKNFQVCIGKGGYGMVYKGELVISGNPTTAAIKRLYEQSGQGLKEFLTEIQLLSGHNHPNLINLLGYCDEEKEKIIVYEYAPRGSLDMYLRGDSTLTWMQRLKICVDASRGLDYLHNRAGNRAAIIHRDIKSSNILIDENWVAKLSDLGLAKLSASGLSRSDVVTHPCGTYGYCEPEYSKTSIVTEGSDVYSFGIVLFEVLCGMLCTNIKTNDGLLLSPSSAKDYYLKNSLDKIVDPYIREEMNLNSRNKFAAIAKRCLHDDRAERPPMQQVVKELEESLEILILHVTQGSSSELGLQTECQILASDSYYEPWCYPSICIRQQRLFYKVEAARRAVEAHKKEETPPITCDRYKAWRLFKHFDLDNDGAFNGRELEAFIRFTHLGIDIFNDSELDSRPTYEIYMEGFCVADFYNLYGKYIGDEKSLTFDAFLLSTHTIKFDLDLALRRIRHDSNSRVYLGRLALLVLGLQILLEIGFDDLEKLLLTSDVLGHFLLPRRWLLQSLKRLIWFILFWALCFIVGLLSSKDVNDTDVTDAELFL